MRERHNSAVQCATLCPSLSALPSLPLQVPDDCSGYMSQLIRDTDRAWCELQSMAHLPSGTRTSIWVYLLDAIMTKLVEGYSRYSSVQCMLCMRIH
jgi:hypothetical protein